MSETRRSLRVLASREAVDAQSRAGSPRCRGDNRRWERRVHPKRTTSLVIRRRWRSRNGGSSSDASGSKNLIGLRARTETSVSTIDPDLVVAHGMAEIEPGLRLHFVTAGKGPRTIVLLHGFPQTWWQWHGVIPMLAASGFRVVAPDYRGAGDSWRPPDGYDKQTMAEDIHNCCVSISGSTDRSCSSVTISV